MFCAAFSRFVWSQRRILGVVPGKLAKGCNSLTSGAPSIQWGLTSESSPFSGAAAQIYLCSNMPPRGKAKAKKEVEENGKERQVRQSRNVKAASYKDLSDSEDEKPIRKRSKKETDSESMSEEEKPKARGKKGRRAPARSRKVDVSDSDEGSEFASSESSAEESSKRRKGGRKPTRSLRGNQNTSYKDLSDSEEESVEEEDSLSEKEKEKKSPPKRGRGRPAAKKSKKEESSNEDEEEEKEDVDDEAEADSGEDEKEKSKAGKPKPKPKSATADSSTDDNAKDKSDDKETVKEDTDKKQRPEHELSEEEEDEEDDKEKFSKKGKDDKVKPVKKEKDEEDDNEDDKEKFSKKGKDDKVKPVKKEKDEEKDSKKRSRADKNGEAATDVKDVKEEPQAKKAKVDEKPALLNKTDTDYDSIDFTSNAKTKDGEPWNFKISSWNVAGLRAWIKKNGLDYIKHENPDILCLQETKCSEQKLPPEAVFEGYEAYWLSGEKEGQAGVAILSKTKPLEVKYGIDKPEFDVDGRVITAEYEKFYLVNTYVPNSGNGLKTLPRRLEWDPAFRAYLKNLDDKKPVILCGDLNVAHSEIDLTNPKTNQKTAGFTPQEREGMTELLKEGFVDTFRSLYPDQTGAYSFWSYFNNARARNIGWRLDYFITSERFLPKICDNIIRNKVYGSDHCPIILLAHV